LLSGGFYGHHEGADEGADGKMIPPTNKEIPDRVLHCSHMEERLDRRGEAELRLAQDAKTDRHDVRKYHSTVELQLSFIFWCAH